MDKDFDIHNIFNDINEIIVELISWCMDIGIDKKAVFG